MQVTVLVENEEREGFTSEHGLSLWISFENRVRQRRHILLDAGQSSAFFCNSKTLGIDVKEANYAVLSHGHYDHAGGFAAFFEENKTTSLHAEESSVNDYYSGSGEGLHPIGIPKEVYPAYKGRFCLTKGSYQLEDGVFLIAHKTEGYPEIGERAKLYEKTKTGEMIPDSFGHERSLVIESEKGLVVFNSCSHSGLVPLLKEVQEAFGGKNVYAFFGGLHLKGGTYSKEEVTEQMKQAYELGLKKIYTGHCTGETGYEWVEEAFSGEVAKLLTGDTIII